MKATYKAQNPDDLVVEFTLSGTLREFKELLVQTSKGMVVYPPTCVFRQALSKAVESAETSYSMPGISTDEASH